MEEKPNNSDGAKVREEAPNQNIQVLQKVLVYFDPHEKAFVALAPRLLNEESRRSLPVIAAQMKGFCEQELERAKLELRGVALGAWYPKVKPE